MKQFLAIFLALLIPISAAQQIRLTGKVKITGRTKLVTPSSGVPSEFTDLYNYHLTRFSDYYSTNITPNWDTVKRRPACMGAELTPADGTTIQAPGYYAAHVTPFLDRLQDMGVNCVKVQIGYPNLYRPYYDWLWNGAGCSHNSSGGSQCALAYANAHWNAEVAFFQQVRTDLTARSMKLNVQSAIQGSAASELNVPSLKYYYDGLTWNGAGGTESYQIGRATNAANVVTLIAPDYINIASEPGHESLQAAKSDGTSAIPEMAASSSNCANPAVYANCIYRQSTTTLITAIMSALAAIPINHTTTKVAAGVATGTYIWPSIVADESIIPGIDLLDAHLHGVTNVGANDSILAVATIADIAFGAGIGFGMNEESLDKSRPGSPGPTPSEQGGGGSAAIYDRQWYSFWNPDLTPTNSTDVAFIHTMLDTISWKAATGTVYYFIYSEPFEFFSTQNYYAIPGCPPPSTTCAAGTITSINTAAATAAVEGALPTATILTNLGNYYKNSIP